MRQTADHQKLSTTARLTLTAGLNARLGDLALAQSGSKTDGEFDLVNGELMPATCLIMSSR